jgi:hypothetical protein
MVKKHLRLATTIAALTLAGGCASKNALSWQDDRPPHGYVHANGQIDETLPVVRYKGSHARGLKIHSFDNPAGGDQAFWSAELVEKLQARGYVLQRQSPIRSGNDVAGTRLDFSYQGVVHPDEPAPQVSYYTALLFVTDEFRVVVQLAGPATEQERARAEIPAILQGIKIGGCKRRQSICNNVPAAESAKSPS